MPRRYSQETPDSNTRLQMEDIGRKAVNALCDQDFRLLGNASAAELGIVLESARKEPPNLPMIALVAGAATVNREIATEAENTAATLDFLTPMVGVLAHHFGHETRV